MAAKKSAKFTPVTSSDAKPAKKAVKVAKKTAAKSASTPDLAFTPAAATPAPVTPPAATPPAKPVVRKTTSKPTLDEIARAAYLNYRRRVEQGLPGDSHGDWVEAERQYSDPS